MRFRDVRPEELIARGRCAVRPAYRRPVHHRASARLTRPVHSLHAAAALEQLRNERDTAWERYVTFAPPFDEGMIAATIIAEPASHEWRLVDAALERLCCPGCRNELGAGPRGCRQCDAADGDRFRARELDRRGAPPGNDHAIRVASVILRLSHRYPTYLAQGIELLLPLLLDGDLPRGDQRLRLEALLDRAAAGDPRLHTASTVDEVLGIVEAAAPVRARHPRPWP